MQSLTEHLTIDVPARMGFVNITPQVAELVASWGVKEGLCLVNAMHITASVFIDDDEPVSTRTMPAGSSSSPPSTPTRRSTAITVPARTTPTRISSAR